MNFAQFMKSKLRTAWIEEPGLSIYVRKSSGLRPEYYGDIQIANVWAKVPGGGAFTRFLEDLEPRFDVMVECVLNPRLGKYLQKRGYRIVSQEVYSPTYLRKKGGA